MEKILFQYPYIVYWDDGPDDYEILHLTGFIQPIRLDSEPYEVIVYISEYSFHLIFGSQLFDNFICIPELYLASTIEKYDSIESNHHYLIEASDNESKIDYNDITAICYALKILNEYIT